MPELGKVFRGKREIRRESSGGLPLWAMCTEKPLRAVGPEGAKPRVPVCFPGKLSQITKNEDRNVPKIAEKPIDKIGWMIYNRSPYCDTMPSYGFYPLHGHFTTERGGCQVPVVQHFAT